MNIKSLMNGMKKRKKFTKNVNQMQSLNILTQTLTQVESPISHSSHLSTLINNNYHNNIIDKRF